MAQILRHGKTPLWGVYDQDILATGDNSGIILDSYNYSVEVKDYEQLDEAGRVVGYLVYDQTVNYDMSGTILYGGTDNDGYTPAHDSEASKHFSINCNNGVGQVFSSIAIHNNLGGVNCKITNPSTAITKSYSVNTSQGGAATFSLSGTIYDFANATDCQN